jgi:hypothetical protein
MNRKLLARTTLLLVALSARPASAYEALVEAHAAATYHYVLGKGEAAGRGALVAGASKADPRYGEAVKGKRVYRQGANKLAQCPGCAGESAIAPPRGTH